MNNPNIPPNPKAPTAHQRWYDSGWGKIVAGLAFFVVSFWLNGVLTGLETGAVESVRIHRMFAFLYNTLGHIPTISILVLMGFGFLIFGIHQMIREGRSRWG